MRRCPSTSHRCADFLGDGGDLAAVGAELGADYPAIVRSQHAAATPARQRLVHDLFRFDRVGDFLGADPQQQGQRTLVAGQRVAGHRGDLARLGDVALLLRAITLGLCGGLGSPGLRGRGLGLRLRLFCNCPSCLRGGFGCGLGARGVFGPHAGVLDHLELAEGVPRQEPRGNGQHCGPDRQPADPPGLPLLACDGRPRLATDLQEVTLVLLKLSVVLSRPLFGGLQREALQQ